MQIRFEIFYGILYSADITYDEKEVTKYNQDTGKPYLVKNKVHKYSFPDEIKHVIEKYSALKEEYPDVNITNFLSQYFLDLEIKISNSEIYIGETIDSHYMCGFNQEVYKLNLGSKEEISTINEKLNLIKLNSTKAAYYLFNEDVD